MLVLVMVFPPIMVDNVNVLLAVGIKLPRDDNACKQSGRRHKNGKAIKQRGLHPRCYPCMIFIFNMSAFLPWKEGCFCYKQHCYGSPRHFFRLYPSLVSLFIPPWTQAAREEKTLDDATIYKVIALVTSLPILFSRFNTRRRSRKGLLARALPCLTWPAVYNRSVSVIMASRRSHDTIRVWRMGSKWSGRGF